MNSQYDNRFSDAVTAVFGTIVRTFERSIIVFWDGLRNATVHGTPSLLGFVAALSPIVAPLYTAIQTARSLTTFLNEPLFQAIIGAVALEFIGFELWVFLTEILMSNRWAGSRIQWALAGGVVVYETALVSVNVILMFMKGTGNSILVEASLMLFLCLMPALAAIGYGYANTQNKAELERERKEQTDRAERIRQEKRADRKEKQRLEAEKFRTGLK
jgi:signal transduction histidine kinase